MAKILVVDDSSSVLEQTEKWLREAEHEVKILKDLAKFKQMLHDFDPDLVLLDVGLKDADGRDADGREIAEKYVRINHRGRKEAKPRIVLYSGKRLDEIMSIKSGRGAHDFIQKTGDKKKFLKEVDRQLDQLERYFRAECLLEKVEARKREKEAEEAQKAQRRSRGWLVRKVLGDTP